MVCLEAQDRKLQDHPLFAARWNHLQHLQPGAVLAGKISGAMAPRCEGVGFFNYALFLEKTPFSSTEIVPV